MTIAEAIAERMRGAKAGSGEGVKVLGISVAPNGFINFEADFDSPSTSVSGNTLEYTRECVVRTEPGLSHFVC